MAPLRRMIFASLLILVQIASKCVHMAANLVLGLVFVCIVAFNRQQDPFILKINYVPAQPTLNAQQT